MKSTSFLALLLLTTVVSRAQDNDIWETYMAQYEKGAGTIIFNMSLKENAPFKNLPFVLITGVTFKNCTPEGFPHKEEFENLYSIEDSIKSILQNKVAFKHAGTFTHQCERLNYYYLKDTTGVRKLLKDLYKNQFSDYKSYTNIKVDKKWDSYLTFLYPNEQTREYIENSKVVMNLAKQGDKLVTPRLVTHWIYFATDADRKNFLTYATKNNFKLEDKDLIGDKKFKYKLQMSRVDKVDLASISKVTIELLKQARKFRGEYDGWETEVVKD